jgi:hypothetical protein
VTDRIVQLARKLETRPWNRPGSDKGWVLRAMWQHVLFQQETKRIPCGGRGRVVAAGAALTAVHEDGAQLDLMLSISGYSFADLAADAPNFLVGDARVRVGRLEKLLRSKELSDRPKDREFLRQFEGRAGEDETDS